jgi:uncharacterized phiE125 gp8 family phage protein
MPTILTTPPSVEPISLAEAKAHVRVTHTDDDTYIAKLISASRRLVEQCYDLCLLQQNWSLFLDQWPAGSVIALPLFPILSIADLLVYGDDDVAATIDHAHYYLDAAARPSRLILRQGRSFPPAGRRANGIEVKLVAGFGTAANAVPETIKQALLIIIADWYASRGDVDAGALPLSAQSLLAPYRHVRLT